MISEACVIYMIEIHSPIETNTAHPINQGENSLIL